MEIDIIYDNERELTEKELLNLNSKKSSIPVEYFRKNLFNATTRESKELKRLKTIYDDGIHKIQVNRSLHLKHRDLLSILFTDNKRIEIQNDGSSIIETSIHYLSKQMGYKNAKDGKHLVKNFLYDLRNTEFLYVKRKDNGHYEEQSHNILGKHYFDSEKDIYIINIPSETNKFKILNFAIEIPKEINRKIVSIPNKYAKTKALISYILSNKALKNGISLDNLCDKLDIINKNRKSEFKKELKENTQLLADFNIYYDEETNIIKYEQICDIKFHRGIKPDEIVEIINEEQIDPKEQELEELINLFQNKFLKAPAKMGGGFVTHKIIEIEQEEKEELLYRLFLGRNVKNEKMFVDWNTKEYFMKLLEQNWVVDSEILS